MNDSDIERIEKATGIKLPEGYTSVIKSYPKELLGTEAEDFGLLNNPESIIEENISVRENSFFGEPWPDRYFIIGINGCGDYFVINHLKSDFSVGFADHEKMECNPYAENLESFIQSYVHETQ
ncbi:SMI1/KNR4 family protein [Shewanella mangrovisoli]|uniref:SMI1/KNR4 family protein n=1 Tax=Shewanella mangrovisoli TaxID=2864211 RepID=UPI00370A894B